MVDEIKSNLEPIEDGDLNLKEKFTGAGGTESLPEEKKEAIFPVEKQPERKEGAVEKEDTYSKILSKIPPQSQKAQIGDVAEDAEGANTGIDAENKVDNLVKIAQAKGIPYAVKVARHMEDNYALDEFHDRLLSEELHSALVKGGLIKEI